MSYPVRFTPLRARLGLGGEVRDHAYEAARWRRSHAPPVTIVAPGEPLAAPPGHDLAVMAAGARASQHHLAVLQHAAHVEPGAAVVAGLVLAPGGREIAAAGLCRSFSDPDRLEGRFAGRPVDHVPALVGCPVLAAAPECALVTSEALALAPGASSVEELCARVWEAGGEVRYESQAHVVTAPGPRPRLPRPARPGVHTLDGRLRIVYVTQETSVGGGHRDVFEHINRLRARGHDVSLYALGPQPDWFDLHVDVRTFADWDALVASLAPLDAIKIATWWLSADYVWQASLGHGVPVYFVQDIETSYYPDQPHLAARVLASYRNEFTYMTISGWNRDRLREFGLDAELVAPGIDLDTFRPLERERRDDMLLALGRRHHLKNLDLTLDAWKALGEPRPELCLFGIDPTLGPEHGARYIEAPSDEEVNALMNEATIFLQTSRHEGFALPPLEAMATGGAVICTDAHGNRDFCVDGVNCLMPEPTPDSVRAAIERLLGDPELRKRLGEAGITTAQEYAWERRIDTLESFLKSASGADVVP